MQDLAQLQNQCERVKTNVRKLAGQMSGDDAEFSYDLISDYKEDRHECADLETMVEVVLARNYK